MKTLSRQAFEEIRLWMSRNARPLDWAMWQYEFENGSKEAVLAALSCYQNADGGFGHALEPDCWNPDSSPYSTLNAVAKLRAIRFADASHPIMRGILRFFESGAHSAPDGWLFGIPSNNDCPCAPWFNFDPRYKDCAHAGVTLETVSFALEFAGR